MNSAVMNQPYPNAQCAMWGKAGRGNIRLHGFLKLKRGRQTRTPAMQAGLVARRLPFRDVFTAVGGSFLFVAVLLRVRCPRQALALPVAAA